MNYYVELDASNNVLSWCFGSVPPDAMENCTVKQMTSPPGPGRWTVVGDDYVVYSPNLTENQTAKIQAATAIYANKIASGYIYTDGHVFQLGPDALGSTGMFNLSAIALLCQRSLAGDTSAWPAGSFIRDAVNNNVIYDDATALAVCTGAGDYVLAVRKRYWDIKATIQAATDQETLDAIDITAGYP